jgi:adenylate kinase
LTVSRRRRNDAPVGRLLWLAAWCALAGPLQAAGPLVVLIGPPGAGKNTQAEILHKERGMAVISADDLIAQNRQTFERFKNPTIQGVDPLLDPALNPLVEEALGKADLSKGLVLSGYPAAKTQADFLVGLREKHNLPKAIVIHLRVPDDVARKRMKGQKDIDEQLKDYHRELDFARDYFPQADIHDVDGNKKIDAVAKEIGRLLQN